MKKENGKAKPDKVLLPNVKNIFVIASGKDGVGKSTVASNLAIALSKTGAKTALFDADLYGPSIPQMFSLQREKIEVWDINGKSTIQPVEQFGLKILSLGFLIDSKDAVIWRGPMASKVLIQLLEETAWGEIDYMIIDLPPGTGDIPLTILQRLNVTGAIIVTTPQSIALAEVIKAANMFRNESINVPFTGVVENMSFLFTDHAPPQKCYLFGQGGGEKLCQQFDIPLLGQIPISKKICESGEEGDPIAHMGHGLISLEFDKMAQYILKQTPVFHEFYY